MVELLQDGIVAAVMISVIAATQDDIRMFIIF
jgi:hypothetical protein